MSGFDFPTGRNAISRRSLISDRHRPKSYQNGSVTWETLGKEILEMEQAFELIGKSN